MYDVNVPAIRSTRTAEPYRAAAASRPPTRAAWAPSPTLSTTWWVAASTYHAVPGTRSKPLLIALSCAALGTAAAAGAACAVGAARTRPAARPAAPSNPMARERLWVTPASWTTMDTPCWRTPLHQEPRQRSPLARDHLPERVSLGDTRRGE